MTYEELEKKYEKLEGKLQQVESQRDYWKQEHRTLEKRMKERERIYLKTNAEKARRILELEKEVESYKSKEGSLQVDGTIGFLQIDLGGTDEQNTRCKSKR